MNKELELLERKDLRDVNVSRIEVLDRVGGLLLLANTELATTEQVAKFYGVTQRHIEDLIKSNRDELESDGFGIKKANNFITELNFGNKVDVYRGGFTVNFDDETSMKFAPRGINVFTKRAILRVGMLLRDSEVAKEVRTRLLDIVQDTSVDNPTTILNVITEISEEKQIMLELLEAQFNGDSLAVELAHTKLHALKNRRIAELEHTNELITTNALTIQDSRDVINRIIRNIAVARYSSRFSNCWTEFYSKINYKLGINIKARDKKKYQSYLDVLTDNEVLEVEKIARCWANDIGLNLDELLRL